MVHDELYTFHLFAGAGGGILGDLLLGYTPVGAVEIEEYPREVLFSRQKDGILPSFPIWDDVTTFSVDNPETRDYIEYLRSIRGQLCICGGFPCQDISVAGKGLGVEKGKRSGLWSEMWRIIGEIRPHYIFVENSPALLTRGFDRVIADLSSIRYDLVWGIVSAADTGAWHRRDRFWGLGIAQEWYGKGNAHPHSVLHGCRGGYGDNPRSCTDPEGRTFRGVGLAYLVNHPEMYWGKEKYPTPTCHDRLGAVTSESLVRKDGKSRMDQLATFVKYKDNYPSPISRDYKGTHGSKSLARSDGNFESRLQTLPDFVSCVPEGKNPTDTGDYDKAMERIEAERKKHGKDNYPTPMAGSSRCSNGSGAFSGNDFGESRLKQHLQNFVPYVLEGKDPVDTGRYDEAMDFIQKEREKHGRVQLADTDSE